MSLVLVAVSKYLGRMAKDGVRIRIVGDRSAVSDKLREAWNHAESITRENRRITLAVAGFGSEELQVQIEDNQLVVRGRQQDDKSRIFLHRGIAARQFQRSFVLADGIEVVGSTLDNGLLHIDLVRPNPEPKARSIPIKPGAGGAARSKTIDHGNGEG
jgi:HSP20 family molecular chaperone IbpA